MNKEQEKRIIGNLRKEVKKEPFAYVLIMLSDDNDKSYYTSNSNIKEDAPRLSVICQAANSLAAQLALAQQEPENKQDK